MEAVAMQHGWCAVRRGVGFGVAAALGAAAAIAFAPREAESATPAVGVVKTQFGTTAADMVTLQLVGPAAARRFARVMPDGTQQLDWRAPTGSALYVADVEWAEGWANPMTGPFDRMLRLRLVNDAMPALAGTVMYPGFESSRSEQGTDRLYSGGASRANVGFLVGPTAHLEAENAERLDAEGEPLAIAYRGSVVVRGYLVRAK
jgi:hypothetical protein